MQIILGDQFHRRVVDGVITPDGNFEMMVLRWGRELGQASLRDLSKLIHALSKERFNAKVRPDHRMGVIENRESMDTTGCNADGPSHIEDFVSVPIECG